MNKDSKFYNSDWPDYYCTECGDLHQLYVDGRCSSCRAINRKELKSLKTSKEHIERVIDILTERYVNKKGMPEACRDWIIQQCKENGYEKLFGYDLHKFVIAKWNQYKKSES